MWVGAGVGDGGVGVGEGGGVGMGEGGGEGEGGGGGRGGGEGEREWEWGWEWRYECQLTYQCRQLTNLMFAPSEEGEGQVCTVRCPLNVPLFISGWSPCVCSMLVPQGACSILIQAALLLGSQAHLKIC